MKKCRQFLLALMIMLCLSGCAGTVRLSEKEADIYEKIHRYYSKMESYSAKVRLTVKGNRNENEYVLEQYAKGNDKTLLRVLFPEELSGTETICNGEQSAMRFVREGLEEHTVSSNIADCSFVNHFLRIYYQSEETALEVSGANEGGGTTLLKTELFNENAACFRASMLIDNKTLAPKNITLYDMGGNVVSVAEFESFVYNDTIRDEIFEIVS